MDQENKNFNPLDDKANILVFRKNSNIDCYMEDEKPDIELNHLSFWNEEETFYNKEHFKNIAIKLVFFLSILLSILFILFIIYKLMNNTDTDNVHNIPVLIHAPTIPHKTLICDTPKIEQSLIYDELEEKPVKKIEIPKTIPFAKNEKSTVKQKEQCIQSESYYIRIGLFDSHYDANLNWQELKVDCYDALKGCSPIVRIIPYNRLKKYELLIGPLTKTESLKKIKQIGRNVRLLSITN